MAKKTKVIAIINQKGGVGKTTTTANLGYVLSKMGRDVLLIDYDSQASLTNYLNVGLHDNDYPGIYEMLLKELRDFNVSEDVMSRKYEIEDELDAGVDEHSKELLIEELDEINNHISYIHELQDMNLQEMAEKFIIKPTYKVIKNGVEVDEEFGMSLLPCVLDLSDYELELGKSPKYGIWHLDVVIQEIKKQHQYDYILIDCNPSLGILSMNAINAATDGVLIPTNLDIMSTRGIINLIDQVVNVQIGLKNHNKIHMGVVGIILNLYADRRTVDKSITDDLKRFYPFRIFNSQIPESTDAKKAALTGKCYAQINKKARNAYEKLAKEIEDQLELMEKVGQQIINIGDEMPITPIDENGEE